MSLSKHVIVRNKEECVQVLSEAMPDVTIHVLKLIAEYVPFRESSLPFGQQYRRSVCCKKKIVCVVQSTRCCSRRNYTHNSST